MSRISLSVSEAVDILELLGCADDPIYQHGCSEAFESTPARLRECDSELSADSIRIEYFGLLSKRVRRTKGTLRSMVLDRLR